MQIIGFMNDLIKRLSGLVAEVSEYMAAFIEP